MAHGLEPMLHPKSVAVIGASDKPERIGGRPISFMKAAGYAGAIYPVNPTRGTVQDLPAFASIKDVPGPVDAAIIAVPAKIAVATVQDCIDAGVKSAVIFTAGFAEMDEAGERAQRELEEIIRSGPMRAVGPNCLGVFNVRDGWYGTFANAPDMVEMEPGAVGIVTQSGAYGSHVFGAAQVRRIAANYWVTTGNECDVDVAEVIEYYAQAPDVKVILAYAEGMKSADRICRALEIARDAEKPVIFQKVGRSELGAQAAASHTASLAGSDAVYDALFKQYGVYRAESTDEMLDVAYACQFGRYPAGRKVTLQTISGGVGVQMADAAEKYGLDVAPMPEATQKKLKELLPFAAVRNPVDFTAQALNEPILMEQDLTMTIEEADYDAFIIYLAGVASSPFTREAMRDILSRLLQKYPDEIYFLGLTRIDQHVAGYEALGIPCYTDPDLMVRAMAALMGFGESFRRGRPAAPPPLPADALPAPTETVGEFEAKRILAGAGIPVTREEMTTNADEAVAAWRGIGGPVVLKIASPDITHKTEIGGVLVNLDDETAIRDGFGTLIERAETAKPDARIDGVIVAEMAASGVETVMGVVSDPVFGPAVMFGLGGIFVEVLKDVTFRLAPFGVDEARRMIDEIQGRAMLDGVRGQPACDIDALAEALSRLSVFADANRDRIESIDVNPFIALPNGAVAVDALIIPKDPSQGEPKP
jgi:acyl-CoA synthetase (NDP forming)